MNSKLAAMKRLIVGAACLILFLGVGAVGCAAQSSIAGDWAGGYEINRNYTPVRVRFSFEGAEIRGTVDFPITGRKGVALNQIRFQSSNLHFEWLTTSGPRIFDGQVSGDLVTGNLQYGSDRGTFHLVRSVNPDPKVLEQYQGDYQIGRDSYVSIWQSPTGEQPSAGLMYTVKDLSSPEHRSGILFPVSETAFVAGPGRWVPYPVEISATFVKNQQGQVTGLKWKPTGSQEMIGKKFKAHLCDEEEVKFSNGDVTIAGTLSLPLRKGAHPAVILISGSDGGTRGRGLPQFFAQHGIVALAYDKRGFGASTGTILGATVENMAGDAAAGVQYLQKRSDIDGSKVGVWAISQGGWMAPVVAITTPNVAFMILHAGPAVSPRLQGRMELVNTWPRLGFSEEQVKKGVEYQNLYFDAMNSDEAYDRLQAVYNQSKVGAMPWVWNPGTKEQLRAQWTRPNVDFDPVPFLQKVKCPVLAFFGEKDVLVPPDGNVSIMETALKKAGNKDVTIKVLPDVNHLFQLPGMGSYGYQTSGKTPPGYYDVMIAWLKKRLDLR